MNIQSARKIDSFSTTQHDYHHSYSLFYYECYCLKTRKEVLSTLLPQAKKYTKSM